MGGRTTAQRSRVPHTLPRTAPGGRVVPVDEVCSSPFHSLLDYWPAEPNRNGCWDWWGYLDTPSQKNRYLTKAAPQMQVIERIIAAVTGAVPAPQ